MKKLISLTLLALLCSTLSFNAAALPEGAKSEFTHVNGMRMHYVKMGQGPLLILLHGWPQTWYEWNNTIPVLAGKFTVVAPDLRGLGLSEKTRTGYDKQTIANDIAELIKRNGAGSAFVVGHDMGGKVAYVLSLLHPELVTKLILVDCMPPGSENMDAAKGGMWHYGFHMAADFPEMLTKNREREYISAQMRKWAHHKDAITPRAIDEYAKHYASPGGMTAGFNYYRALPEDARFVSTYVDKKFTMPILTIAGRYGVSDKLFKAMRPKADNLKGVIAEDSGHFVPEEASTFLVEQIMNFLTPALEPD
ncbi:alpha/beta hydrolase [Candidatus Methylospira mobilis]|uniref:Alpha/beta hydrolase n=1 Tax=Candidatus Methylospira mobilis TaxID=1808979 RepID=A0A5Q0BIX4_9GAMM|nr:alpha/beta hydrolase [Candidatus Methylospira mobilis]QFY43763.1 alpha/beta hydrolase [Candidatus Methylospira mobilis]WNV04752.1 alpha/beta hydrolase [Candidatus Methylospira mobilis]